MLFSVAHGADVLSWLSASDCCSAQIFNVPLNAGPANYSNATRAFENVVCAQEQVEVATSIFLEVFLETDTAHKT